MRRVSIQPVLIAVFVFAGLIALLASNAEGPLDRGLHGDAPFYSDLAYSMTSGQGYLLHLSPWSTTPNLARLPLWPALLTPGALLIPQKHEGLAVRGTGMLIHALAAALIALLTFRLWSNRVAAAISGVLFATFPAELARVASGDSEPAFFVFATGGLLLLLRSGSRRTQACGALLSGAAVLGRSNYMILPFAAAIGIWIVHRELFRYWKQGAALAALFLLPVSLWVVRNYLVSGAFPVVTSVDGETLYGANNVVVATTLDSWAGWIVPEQIPGERPRSELARTMTEAQVNVYYRKKALAFMWENWRSYPRLLLGKLVRAFTPFPWVDFNLSAYVAYGWQAVIYLAFLWYAAHGIVTNKAYRIYLIAVFLIAIATTVIFYGSMRFTLCLDTYLLPVVSAGMAQQRFWKSTSGLRGEPA